MLRHLVLVGALTAVLPAQSPLTTVYAGGYSLAGGATFYVDLVLNAPITFQQLDVNTNSPLNTAGTLDVRWTTGMYVGNVTNATAWTLGGSGPVVAAGANLPSVCTLAPFTLPPGNYGLAITFNGIGPSYPAGNGTATPGSGTNQTFSTSEITMLCGASSQGAPGAAICCEPRVFSGSIHYAVGGSGTVAQRTTYGTGCYLRAASFYESFATSAAFDLGSSSLSMLATGGSYTVLGGIATYVPPSAAATSLVLGDDAQATVALTAPFPHAAGLTSSLVVCSNGYVSVATGNGTTYTPSATAMLAAPQTAWWNWHDYNPTMPGSGQVKFEQIGAVAYVTWDGVYDHTGTSAANANTFQFQFDTATGTVHLVFGAMSALGNARLVGYSPGGSSLDPGNVDLSAVLPQSFTLPRVEAPLALAASARPVLGTTIDLVTSNQTGTSVGVNFLGVAQIPAPGVDLGVIGAPGCPALLDVNQAVGNVIGNVTGLGMNIVVPIPNNTALNGLQLFSQSAWLDPTANAFGILTSNGVALVLGNL